MRENFPHKKPRDHLSAKHVNDLGRVAKRAGTPLRSSYMNQKVMGSSQGYFGTAPFLQIPCRVLTDLGEQNEIYEGMYEIQIRDFVRLAPTRPEKWKVNQNNNKYYLDAYSLGTKFYVGDLLMAHWSEQRGMFLPTSHAMHYNIAKAPTGGIPAISGTTPGSAVCDIYHIVEGVLEAVTDDQDEQVTRTLYNLSGVAVTASAWVQYKVNIDGHHLVDFEGCTA